MSYVPCCVPGCKDRTSSRHRFPIPRKDKKRFLKWIKLIRNENLTKMDPLRVYNSYRVCNQHFTCDFLNLDTLPSKKLPRKKDDVEEDDDGKKSKKKKQEEAISFEKESLNKKQTTDEETSPTMEKSSNVN